ncbi:MAG: hypothetical protein GF365_03390 [Candidatus Buchananbacteria bacterium]|nr:hypothetical protein [Candidatus Buchananbacteria bacterium]
MLIKILLISLMAGTGFDILNNLEFDPGIIMPFWYSLLLHSLGISFIIVAFGFWVYFLIRRIIKTKSST